MGRKKKFVPKDIESVKGVGDTSAKRVMHSITEWIEKKLGLKVNATKTKITRPNGLKYLGFGFY